MRHLGQHLPGMRGDPFDPEVRLVRIRELLWIYHSGIDVGDFIPTVKE
jgi:hypothetical protein